MNILLSLTLLIVSWSIDSTDPAVQWALRLLFLAVHGAAAVVVALLFYRIWAAGETVIVESKDSYTGERLRQRTWAYDSSKLRELAFTKIGLAAVVSYFAAARFGQPFPLLLQSINNPVTIYHSPLFQVHALGRPATGELARPWEGDAMIPEWLRNMWADSAQSSTEMVSRYESGGGGAPSGNGAAAAAAKKKK